MVKAFASLYSHEVDTDTSKVVLYINYTVLGDSIGDYVERNNSIAIPAVQSDNRNTMKALAASAIQIELESHGIVFQAGDEVTVW